MIPKRKVTKFTEEFEDSKEAGDYKTAFKVLEKAETYYNIEGDDTVLRFLIRGYLLFKKLEKAEYFCDIYQKIDKSGYALYFKALIEGSKGNLEKSISLLKEVLTMAKDKTLRLKALSNLLINLAENYRYREMDEILNRELKVFTPADLMKKLQAKVFPPEAANILVDVYPIFERYFKGREFFSKGIGKEILDTLKKELEDRNIKFKEISPTVEEDFDEPIETPTLCVILAKNYDEEVLEGIEKRLTEEFLFNRGVEFSVEFQVASPEVLVGSN